LRQTLTSTFVIHLNNIGKRDKKKNPEKNENHVGLKTHTIMFSIYSEISRTMCTIFETVITLGSFE